MLERTEKAGGIQSVERPSSQEEKKTEQPLSGKINTLTEKKFFCCQKWHAQNLATAEIFIQNEHWVGCQPRVENGCSSWNCASMAKNSTKKIVQQKTNVFKIECWGSYGQLQTEKQTFVDF
jgi:hypothetical protein